MEARNRKLEDWYGKIHRGEIKLPRFQRYEAWDWRRICSLINTITQNLPLGITLVLEVGEREQFVSRYISTAPEKYNRVLEHLLDGQQRLTALWRILYNNYEWQTYFVYIPEFDEYGKKQSEEQMIYCRGRYRKNNGIRYPLWCDNPEDCLKRGMIPTNLLKPEDIQTEIDQWITVATNNKKPKESEKFEDFFNWKKSVSDKIKDLRSVIKNYNLPYLSLPSNTSKDIALEVFINMNTNSKPLSTYDIIVAEVESELGQSLHDKQNQLLEDYSAVGRYDEISRLILNTSSLLQDKFPNQRGVWDMDKKEMVLKWDVMCRGLYRMVDFIAEEGIFDDNRLPTNAILWVIAALYSVIPESGDKRGWAEKLLKKYLWRAFFTNRYENSAATHAYYDYLALKRIIREERQENGQLYSEDSVPIFDECEYEVAFANELVNAGWPKNMSIRGRAVLAITCKLGAYDFSTEEKVTVNNIEQRHYHHIFPDSLLKEAGLENRFIAMNCALIKDATNLNIGRKDPLQYLKERYQWADENTIYHRLNSHLIPIKELSNGGYENLSDDDRRNKIKKDYYSFINKRASFFELTAKKLCAGNPINSNEILNEFKDKT